MVREVAGRLREHLLRAPKIPAFRAKDRWVFPKMMVPNNHGFSYTKNDHFGVFGGVPPFKETPR